MKYNTMVITGSNGATASELIRYFSKVTRHVAGISRLPKEDFSESNVKIFTADMEKPNEAHDVSNKIISKYKTIDIWVNCIGGFNMGSSIKDDSENWDNMFKVNFLTCLHGSQEALIHMTNQKMGYIINIGSQAAVDGFPNAAPYLVSKSSVHMLTRLIALENSNNNIRANAILPGIIDTNMNRDAMPDEDFSTWQTPVQIAKTIEDTIDSGKSGMLISVDN
jgi:short-subunit dehydrogenase